MPKTIYLFTVFCLNCGFFCASVLGQVAMSSNARIDVISSDGELSFGRLNPQFGTVYRMSWLPTEQQPRTLVAELPAFLFAITKHEFRFEASSDSELRVELRGTYQELPGGRRERLEIDFEDVTVTGAEVRSSPQWPQRVWHDEPAVMQLHTLVDTTVTITVRVRYAAASPPPQRKVDRGTAPAFRLAMQFRRGVNLANELEVPPGEDWGGITYREQDYRWIAAEGFDHVRIPVGWHHHCGRAPNYEIDESFFRQVEQQLDWAEQYHLAAIINMHHFNSFTDDPIAEQDKLIVLWRQIAIRFRNRPFSVAFEILNEPRDAATTKVMSLLYQELIPQLRTIDSKRAIFVGPGEYNRPPDVADLILPDDDRLIVTLHTYSPHPFTHQGAVWSGDTKNLPSLVYPGPPAQPAVMNATLPEYLQQWLERYNTLPGLENPCSETEVRFEFAVAQGWSEYFGRPLHLGEFGAYTAADLKSRANYYRTVRRLAEEAEMGWCIWDWKASFDYFDIRTQRPFAGLHEALFDK